MQKITTRVAWIDAAKGWAMILVMLGHAHCPLRPLIYVFHVPLFFFLSGYLFNQNRYSGPVHLLRSRGKRLLIPYLAFATFNALIWIVLNHRAFEGNWINLANLFAAPLLGLRKSHWAVHMVPFWFLPCLLTTELLFCTLGGLTDRRLRGAALLTLILLGFAYGLRQSPLLPWGLDVAPVALLFFFAGNALKGKADRPVSWWQLPLGLVGVAAGLLNGLSTPVGRVDMFLNDYGNPLLFVFGAFGGIYGSIWVVRRIPNLRPIQFVGQYSIVFLCLHDFPVFALLRGYALPFGANQIAAAPSASASWPQLVLQTCFSILLVTIACLMITPVVLLLRSYAPWLLGASAAKAPQSAIRETEARAT